MDYEDMTLGQLTLGELIDWLKSNKGQIEFGFGRPMSYRGSYDELAFEPVENTTGSAMLHHAESAVDVRFEGYKGGEFMMTRDTPVWIAPYGESGEPIGRLTLKLWESQL